MRRNPLRDIVMAPILLVVAFILVAQKGMCTEQYKIAQQVIASGGATHAGTHFGTVGQPMVGSMVTDPIRHEVGFWYQPGYVITAVEPNEDRLPTEYHLGQNYPNPFNPRTVIRFSLPTASYVTLKIYDARGREVATLIDGRMKPGVHRAVFDAAQIASGVYFYRIKAGEFSQTKKLVLLK